MNLRETISDPAKALQVSDKSISCSEYNVLLYVPLVCNLYTCMCIDKHIFQFMTFLTKLTEGHIGVSGWKLFYVNKFTMKTVSLASMMLNMHALLLTREFSARSIINLSYVIACITFSIYIATHVLV